MMGRIGVWIMVIGLGITFVSGTFHGSGQLLAVMSGVLLIGIGAGMMIKAGDE